MKEHPWFKRYDKGVPRTIDYPAVPLYYFLEESARKYPDKPCTIFKGATISYKEMDLLTDKVAAALAALGVKKGDRVGVFMPNTPQFVMAYFGILKAGGVVVATNPLYTPPEIEHQVNDAGVEIMLVMSNFYEKMKVAQPKTKIKTLIVTNLKETLPPILRVLFTLVKEKKGGFRVELKPGDIWFQDLLAKYSPSDRPKMDIGPDDTALFQYSGGTTGISKGAIAMHRNLVANALQIKSYMPDLSEGNELVLMAIPLFHVYGMVAGMLFAMAAGSSMVLEPDPRAMKDILGDIQKLRPTIYPGVPAMYNAINNNADVQAGKYDVSSIKACISGSAPLMRETKEKFEALTGGKLVEGYGLSEAPTATHCNPVHGENRTGSIGLPLPDVDAKIISLDDGKTEMPIGEIGELVVKGPQVFKGYHNMPTETANTLRDGWLYTGDIARMDEDGYFYIVDRKKELIKPGGYQVWPREVEEAISANPKVLEVGVAGIPDPYRGETVKAWVVVKPGETLTEDEIKAWCKERLAAFKVPTHIEFRNELPKTTVGKVLRRELVRQHKESSK
ncbi:MAG: long-chain fatty acid--CoA ligase [Anaerolineae bacterium CG17_big_fil_post_rev_8_21_14_2_50_57_27]|nr:MAG: long-chain fatty acid--CoA ligase [Anaerolineae bacterium CG06_land_8_20_14_3_00_57_67]PIW20033.1 MAG: long-chain fatty acid--CoA ligase [Anaerolineae bacterium CG17_big_fil_post_rev_8_21_14_2_50_57_27]PJH74980.1 MAG: long-chain fatty acid--CoA ligase [Anaerolineae bacterium CG_4_9_14_0_8_um_filter_58_9]